MSFLLERDAMSLFLEREAARIVAAPNQRSTLQDFHKRENHFTEASRKNKPLCFSARRFQQTHPEMLRPDKQGNVHRDADATLASPMLLGVADGVSSLKALGIDGSELPNELLEACNEIAMSQLISERDDHYSGPVSLIKEAYEETESLGSTTVLLAVLDNSSLVHGKVHPMIAVLNIGDCEFLLLRRKKGHSYPLEVVFHTEMQRLDDRVNTPLQLGRVDERIDPHFHEGLAFEVIDEGSSVQCVSTFEGDIVVLGSDGIFDNLFLDEIVDTCNYFLSPPDSSTFVPLQPMVLTQIGRQLVHQSHTKTKPGAKRHLPDTPIGKGGKMDDTSVVVAEVIEWSEDVASAWSQHRRERQWEEFFGCSAPACDFGDDEDCSACRAPEIGSDLLYEEEYEEETKALVDL